MIDFELYSVHGALSEILRSGVWYGSVVVKEIGVVIHPASHTNPVHYLTHFTPFSQLPAFL